MIQFAGAVGSEVVLALYGIMEDLLVKSKAGNFLGAGPSVAEQSQYPGQSSSTVVESVASRLQYSLPTIPETAHEFTEHFSVI